MLGSNSKKRGAIGAVILAGVLALGGYALTNVITFEETTSLAGLGNQEIQVLEVTDTDYTLDTTDKSEVETITFLLDSALVLGDNADGVAYMKINDAYAWSACDAIADTDTTVVCDITTPASGNIGTIGVNGEDLRLVLAE